MITFLRKIRKSLIESGSARKYILYAVGEILLVMIGILLALQVNNWNEATKAANEESVYLKRLLVDLENDSSYFNQRLKESTAEIQGYYDMIHEARNIQSSEKEFRVLLGKGFYSSQQLTIHNSTYTELINTGNIELIRNNALKLAILNLYRKYESVGNHIEEINLFSSSLLRYEHEVTPYFKYIYGRDSLFDNDSFFDDEEWSWINEPSSRPFRLMEETVGTYHFKHSLFKSYFEELLRDVKLLSQMIDDEIGD